jgi:hypothetical protein
LSATGGIKSIPTKTCGLSNDRIDRIVAPSMARRAISRAALDAVSRAFPSTPASTPPSPVLERGPDDIGGRVTVDVLSSQSYEKFLTPT